MGGWLMMSPTKLESWWGLAPLSTLVRSADQSPSATTVKGAKACFTSFSTGAGAVASCAAAASLLLWPPAVGPSSLVGILVAVVCGGCLSTLYSTPTTRPLSSCSSLLTIPSTTVTFGSASARSRSRWTNRPLWKLRPLGLTSGAAPLLLLLLLSPGRITPKSSLAVSGS